MEPVTGLAIFLAVDVLGSIALAAWLGAGRMPSSWDAPPAAKAPARYAGRVE